MRGRVPLCAATLAVLIATALPTDTSNPSDIRRDIEMTALAKNPKNALLPPDFVQPTLRDVRPGQVIYLVPWAMSVDREYRCWLNLSHSPDDTPGGTVQMRAQLQQDGWHVRLVRGYRYPLTDTPKPDSGLAPVVGLYE